MGWSVTYAGWHYANNHKLPVHRRRFTFALHEADRRLTRRDDDLAMWKAAATAALASLALAAPGAAAGPSLPGGWMHAEINFVVNRVPHTLVLDRGRVTAVAPGSMTLRAQDGSSVQIALAAETQVIVDGRPGQLSDIRRGVTAVTQRIDGGAARQVRIHVPPRLSR